MVSKGRIGMGLRAYIAAALWGLTGSALADAAAPVTLDKIQVQATRLHGVDAFDVPASISVAGFGTGLDRANASVSEVLAQVPGLLARERQNLAQDTQLSIRGFGARSTFGVRGLRLYADGVPATMPDGQGQVSHFSLAAAERVEVMRGPFSALYGNSSGGVLQIWSAPPDGTRDARIQAVSGRDSTHTLGARVRGAVGKLGVSLAASTLETDGWRAHSAAKRHSANLNVRIPLAGDGRLDLVGNYFESPDADDPLGLTRAQALADPRQATPQASQYDTRKSVRQRQLGAVYTQPFGDHTLRAMAYAGNRWVEQFLALPMAAQLNPLNSGGVIDLNNDYAGADLRWSWQGSLAGRPLEASLGLNADRQRQHRQGYENHLGGVLGLRGAQRRNERNTVENVDQYAQVWWQLAPRWSLLAGLRHSQVRFRSEDGYVTGANPDDSGRVAYSRSTPVAGVMFQANQSTRLYLSAGRGFETPTFNELAYRADGGAGLAFDLKPATSRNLELGGKWQWQAGVALEAALFRADTDDELAVARNVAGRSSYHNAGRARREGAELALNLPLAAGFETGLAWTWMEARFRDRFQRGTASVSAGSPIPGIPRQQLAAHLNWRGQVWSAGAEVQAVSDVVVNDVGDADSPGYTLLHLELARDFQLPAGKLHGFVRVDNALNQRYIGSVIVNEGNGRYYEPGPDRGVMVGLRWGL